jgi:hypothetical protein
MDFAKHIIRSLAALVLVGTLAMPSAAQERKGWREAPWRFIVNGYAWLPKAPVDIKVDLL